MIYIYISTVAIASLRFTRPLKASLGEDGGTMGEDGRRWERMGEDGRRGEMGGEEGRSCQPRGEDLDGHRASEWEIGHRMVQRKEVSRKYFFAFSSKLPEYPQGPTPCLASRGNLHRFLRGLLADFQQDPSHAPRIKACASPGCVRMWHEHHWLHGSLEIHTWIRRGWGEIHGRLEGVGKRGERWEVGGDWGRRREKGEERSELSLSDQGGGPHRLVPWLVWVIVGRVELCKKNHRPSVLDLWETWQESIESDSVAQVCGLHNQVLQLRRKGQTLWDWATAKSLQYERHRFSSKPWPSPMCYIPLKTIPYNPNFARELRSGDGRGSALAIWWHSGRGIAWWPGWSDADAAESGHCGALRCHRQRSDDCSSQPGECVSGWRTLRRSWGHVWPSMQYERHRFSSIPLKTIPYYSLQPQLW